MAPDNKPSADFSDVTSGASSTAPKAAGTERSYTVVKGDSLSKIAEHHYGDAGKWRAIYEANKSVIGENPNLIKPGQIFTLPEA